VRGTGIAKRTHEYVAQKMKEGKAVIALEGNKFAGFSDHHINFSFLFHFYVCSFIFCC
jgi:hypothetical protein